MENMNKIMVKCPAKINLTLEILNKRKDGFHNINSIMQMISLFDILEISVKEADHNSIILSGNSSEIPYNSSNLVYKAADLFLNYTKKENYLIEIYIDKKIPIAAGLAGGSTDAAGTIWGLNKIFGGILSRNEMHELCSKLGSDLNVCLEGGCILATSRGEKTEKIDTVISDVTLIKPKYLGISAKEAYTKYSLKKISSDKTKTPKMLNAIKNKQDINQYLYNDLETAVYDDYEELQYIKKAVPNAIMSGSGSTYFVLKNLNNLDLGEDYLVINNLKFISTGVE